VRETVRRFLEHWNVHRILGYLPPVLDSFFHLRRVVDATQLGHLIVAKRIQQWRPQLYAACSEHLLVHHLDVEEATTTTQFTAQSDLGPACQFQTLCFRTNLRTVQRNDGSNLDAGTMKTYTQNYDDHQRRHTHNRRKGWGSDSGKGSSSTLFCPLSLRRERSS
jgi:hypothetical protein